MKTPVYADVNSQTFDGKPISQTSSEVLGLFVQKMTERWHDRVDGDGPKRWSDPERGRFVEACIEELRRRNDFRDVIDVQGGVADEIPLGPPRRCIFGMSVPATEARSSS